MSYSNIYSKNYWKASGQLIRINNLLILFIAQLCTVLFLCKGIQNFETALLQNATLWLLFLATFCIAAGGYAINDYYDVKIDLVNKPFKILVGRLISRRGAMKIHMVFSALGLLLSIPAGMKVLILNALAVFLLWWYSNYLKRLPLVGNLVVALLSGYAIYLVGFRFSYNTNFVFFYACFAFFSSLIREIIKDMEDLKGDQKFGCNTLPIKYGIAVTSKIVYFISALFVASLVFMLSGFGVFMLSYFLVMVLAPLAYCMYKLSKADTKKEFTFLSRLCKLIMICGILSMIFIDS